MSPAKIGQWPGPPPPRKLYIDFALEGWQRNSDKVAIIDVNSGQEVTYRQLEYRVQEFAGRLQALGVCSRRKVQFYANNHLDTFIAMQALLFCSSSMFIFKPTKATKYGEYKFQTEDSEVEFIVTDAASYDTVVYALLADEECQVKKVLIVEGMPKKPMPEGKVLFTNQLPKGKFTPPADVNLREDVLLVSYTSGSTGMPKGVIHSHYTFVTGLFTMSLPHIEIYNQTDRAFVCSSLTYVTGTIFTSGALTQGGTIILGNGSLEENIPLYVEKYKATTCLLLECPTKAMLKNAHSFPNVKQMVSTLRKAVVGGTVFPKQLRCDIRRFLGDVPLQHVYGMTEAFGAICTSEPAVEFTPHVGFLLPHFEARIVKDNGELAEVGEMGELQWKGPQLTLGYWKRQTDDFTPDGFYTSGDLVCTDEKGNITIVDRKKHFIICLDERVSPTEIEDVLLQHSGVREVVVVGTPHPEVGEAPTAMVVIDCNFKQFTTHDQLAQQLVDFVASQLCADKYLYGGVHFVESLPKTDSGKYARSEILKQAKIFKELTQ